MSSNLISALRNMVDDIGNIGASPVTVDVVLIQQAIAALAPAEGYEDLARDAARYRLLRRSYLQCWEDAQTEEPTHANFCFECKGWDIDRALDAELASESQEEQ